MTRPVPDADGRAGVVLRRRSIVLAGAALGATVVAPSLTTTAASLGEQDVRALNTLLLVEYAQVAFYTEAVRRGGLTSELSAYAKQVASQEREHLGALRAALGGRAASEPGFDFGDATRRPDSFAAAATDIEDLAVSAYNGQGTAVSPAVLAEAARIVSVEARHAAWIRSIVGQLPAPGATDRALSADQVEARLNALGMR
jgi:Ferritin-like domain